jgi:hypothetical protein
MMHDILSDKNQDQSKNSDYVRSETDHLYERVIGAT